MNVWSLLLGFTLGVIASGIVAVWYAWAVQPRLRIGPYSGEEQLGERDGKRFKFYLLTVSNDPPPWPLARWTARQPAWSCRVRMDLLQEDGTPFIESVIARWISQPEPLSRTGPGGFPLFDWALWVQGQRIDIHEHNPESIVVAVKDEGEAGCYLFSNDSYQNSTWKRRKPDWKIPPGKYRLKLTILYQRKPTFLEFRFHNEGTSLEELQIVPA